MKKIIVSVCAIGILFGEAIAMRDVSNEPSSTQQIAKMALHFDASTLRNFTLSDAVASNVTNLYIEKYAYVFLSMMSQVFQCSMRSAESLILLSNVHLKHSEEFVEIPLEEGIYLAALSRIFSGEKREVSDESLNDILFAAQHGNEDAKFTVRLACKDSSYEDAIVKGEYRAKECLKNRILGWYELDFYYPIIFDFPAAISSSSDWREPFRQIQNNMSALIEGKGDIENAYAAVQDVCCLYETLKEQYKAHSEDVEFRGHVKTFLSVASRVFANLGNEQLRFQFERLSSSVQSNDPNCIDNAQGLFAAAAMALEQHGDSDSN